VLEFKLVQVTLRRDRKASRKSVIQALRKLGEASRRQIMDETNLSSGTVHSVILDLRREGICDGNPQNGKTTMYRLHKTAEYPSLEDTLELMDTIWGDPSFRQRNQPSLPDGAKRYLAKHLSPADGRFLINLDTPDNILSIHHPSTEKYETIKSEVRAAKNSWIATHSERMAGEGIPTWMRFSQSRKHQKKDNKLQVFSE